MLDVTQYIISQVVSTCSVDKREREGRCEDEEVWVAGEYKEGYIYIYIYIYIHVK